MYNYNDENILQLLNFGSPPDRYAYETDYMPTQSLSQNLLSTPAQSHLQADQINAAARQANELMKQQSMMSQQVADQANMQSQMNRAQLSQAGMISNQQALSQQEQERAQEQQMLLRLAMLFAGG